MKMDAVEDVVCSSEEYANPGNFAMIAKISLGLRKFRNHSKNFAREISLGFQISLITVPSEIIHFRYL